MGRDETPIRAEIEMRVNDLRADLQTLEMSAAIDERMMGDLREIIEEIDGCLRATNDRSIRATPNLTD